MKLADVPTPALILDRARLRRNIARMADAVKRNGVTLRPHLKTAKSIDVAQLALVGQPGGIAVSTLREAEYFAQNGVRDIQYAAGIVPDKLDRVVELQKTGARITLITDNICIARAIRERGVALNSPFHVLVEIDTGEERAGVFAQSDELVAIARVLHESAGSRLAGVMTHAGHSYRCRTIEEVAKIAEDERSGVVTAAERLRAEGLPCETISVGSTPTGLHARDLTGVTEVRAGVYMFGDMFQAQICSCGVNDLAVSVMAEVTGHRAEYNRLLVDAGALALSKDRSTELVPNDVWFGLVSDLNGTPYSPQLIVSRVHQEHGQVDGEFGAPLDDLPIGTRVRVFPNHVCMTAAMYDRYYVVDSEAGSGDEVVAVWPRINGW